MLREDQLGQADAAVLLDEWSRAIDAIVLPAVTGHGLTVEAWRTLLLLADGRGHAMGEVIGHARVSAPAATRLTDRLVADNLVYRFGDPADGRRVLIHLSPTGARVVEAARDEIAQLMRHSDRARRLCQSAAALTSLYAPQIFVE